MKRVIVHLELRSSTVERSCETLEGERIFEDEAVTLGQRGD
jgi:hypothetical protein